MYGAKGATYLHTVFKIITSLFNTLNTPFIQKAHYLSLSSMVRLTTVSVFTLNATQESLPKFRDS